MPRLLKGLAHVLPFDEKLDAVVVDEAQDFAPLWWEALLACLKKPDDGVYAFMDERQNVYGRWDAATAGTAEGPTAGLITLHLDENLRNTKTNRADLPRVRPLHTPRQRRVAGMECRLRHRRGTGRGGRLRGRDH